MAKRSLLERMRANARGDWKIKDVQRLCRSAGMHLEPPTGGGSHYKASSPHLSKIQAVPADRPIKPCYIQELVKMVDAHQRASERRDEK